MVSLNIFKAREQNDSGIHIVETYNSNDHTYHVNEKDLEKAEINSIDENYDNIFGEDRNRLKQGLEQRHLQMLALVGVFGTGIFLSSGGVLKLAGPLGTVIAYSTVAVLVGLNQIAMAEVTCLFPVSSAALRHTEHFLDPSLAFANGWAGFWSSIMPGEISAADVIISYWTDILQAAWITIIIVLIIASNCWNVRFYGEVEFFCID